MTITNGWQQQPGGLYLAARSFDKTDGEHRDAIALVVRDSVQKIAKVHGAPFSEAGFQNNIRALYNGDIQADMFMAKWEVCAPKAIFLGAALNWETFGFNQDGSLSRAIYTEDVCLLTSQIRELIRVKPKGKQFPDGRLAERFERLSLNNMINRGISYRYGEVNLDNTTMVRNLVGNGAEIGTNADSAVLEFRRLPNDLSDRFPMVVKVVPVNSNGKWDANNFRVHWPHRHHDIRLIVTKGQATAAGMARADIRLWHNGHLPDQSELECVIASSLRAIKLEAERPERNWGLPKGQIVHTVPSPSIPLLGRNSEILSALYDASGNEISINPGRLNSDFGKPFPDAHIYIMNDRKMIDGFTAAGAEPRVFGEWPMKPAVNIIKNYRKLVA